jgi:hypothetical protein
VQVLNDDNLLVVQADLQLTPNSLLPSQQFVIGGGNQCEALGKMPASAITECVYP